MIIIRFSLIAQNIGVLKYFVVFGVVANLCLITLLVGIAINKNFLKKILLGCIWLLAKLKNY